MKCKLYLIAPIFLMACLASPDGNAASLQKDADAAQNFEYCNWAFTDDGKLAGLTQYKAALAVETQPRMKEAWSESLVEIATDIARSASSKRECTAKFAKGEKAFKKQLKKALKKNWARAKYEKNQDQIIADVQAQMATHWVEDQSARHVYIASRTDDKTGADYWTRSLAAVHTSKMDTRSTAFMRDILEDYDWIDRERFGERVSMAAWLLVQHADDHVELQSKALSRMEPYLKSGGVSKGDYAFLWDRVAVNSGEKQRYGTQPTWECTSDNRLTLQPLEDPDNVNARRETMGLGSVEDGLADMAADVCR